MYFTISFSYNVNQRTCKDLPPQDTRSAGRAFEAPCCAGNTDPSPEIKLILILTSFYDFTLKNQKKVQTDLFNDVDRLLDDSNRLK